MEEAWLVRLALDDVGGKSESAGGLTRNPVPRQEFELTLLAIRVVSHGPHSPFCRGLNASSPPVLLRRWRYPDDVNESDGSEQSCAHRATDRHHSDVASHRKLETTRSSADFERMLLDLVVEGRK
jgi:hypothetical protein